MDTFNTLLNAAIEISALIPILMFLHFALQQGTPTASTPAFTDEEMAEALAPYTDAELAKALAEIREDLGYELESQPEYISYQLQEITSNTLTTAVKDSGTANPYRLLEDMSKEELKTIARDKKLTGYSRLRKAELLQLIKAN